MRLYTPNVRLTRVTNSARTSEPLARSRLRILSGPAAADEIDLPAVGVVIGADPGVDVVLADDDAVSSRHCTVVPKEDGFLVTDLDSKNGTFVDGVALSRGTVPVGATLRLGRTLVQLLPGEQVVNIPPSSADAFGDMIGSSAPMRQIYALLERAAPSDASVLLTGESGTGKELAARAIHQHSARSDGPFVVFDCGAASETLTDSALFGHKKGAFTGATTDRLGAFAAADGGTLFLDEIGDLPLELQPKLLRLLEAGEVTPLGQTDSQRYDVRIVAATHRDLYGDVASGAFRGDLYYRLAVVEVELPPLRARQGDIPMLASRFLGGEFDVTDGTNLDRLRRYSWPGNVRELRNVAARARALAPPDAVFEDLPILLRGGQRQAATETVTADRPYHEAKAELVDRFEKAYLTDLLRRASGNISEAARQAGVERKHLYKMLERAGLR